MDAIDRKILAVVQQDASLSVAEIGQRVGLSSTPCWKRLQKLEAEGVITRRVALIDPEKIGLGITVFVSVESGDHSDAWLKTFASAVSVVEETRLHSKHCWIGLRRIEAARDRVHTLATSDCLTTTGQTSGFCDHAVTYWPSWIVGKHSVRARLSRAQNAPTSIRRCQYGVR